MQFLVPLPSTSYWLRPKMISISNSLRIWGRSQVLESEEALTKIASLLCHLPDKSCKSLSKELVLSDDLPSCQMCRFKTQHSSMKVATTRESRHRLSQFLWLRDSSMRQKHLIQPDRIDLAPTWRVQLPTSKRCWPDKGLLVHWTQRSTSQRSSKATTERRIWGLRRNLNSLRATCLYRLKEIWRCLCRLHQMQKPIWRSITWCLGVLQPRCSHMLNRRHRKTSIRWWSICCEVLNLCEWRA